MSFHRKVFCGSKLSLSCCYLHNNAAMECISPPSVSCRFKIPERLAADHPLESETVRADDQARVVKKFCLGS